MVKRVTVIMGVLPAKGERLQRRGKGVQTFSLVLASGAATRRVGYCGGVERRREGRESRERQWFLCLVKKNQVERYLGVYV